jgi:RND family efflux transporter MFP subunit
MSAIHRSLRRLFIPGLLLVALGCSREQPLAEAPPPEVIVAHPVKDLISDSDVYTGTVQAKDSVEVRARVRGHILKVLFKEGDEIDRGAELFEIDSEPFKADLKQAEGQLTTLQARLKVSEQNLTMYETLLKKDATSKEEYNKAVSAVGEALGAIDSTKGKIMDAQLNIGYCKINAPIAGRVGESLLSKGDLVNSSGADSLLTTIVAVNPMYVSFYVNEKAYRKYRRLLLEEVKKDPNASKGAELKIPVEMAVSGEDFSSDSFKGYVDFVDNRVDPATGSIKVRARFENPKGPDGRRPLTAGSFARVKVTLAEKTPAILVTDRAILTDQSLKYVFVVDKAKKVERVEVTAAERKQEDGLRAVKGLKGDEWVIVDGVNRARPGITVNPTEKDMPRLKQK